MNEYRIFIPARYMHLYNVHAKSKEEAVRQVLDGEAESHLYDFVEEQPVDPEEIDDYIDVYCKSCKAWHTVSEEECQRSSTSTT